ncbi:MAG: sugar transferase [Desulfobacterales bacterium]|nr:MAG: sugar transferase [Desulfobacterales bacterium]
MNIISGRYPSVSMPLIDRPFIQHVIESIARQGISDIEVILSHLPEKIKDLLGDGERWGVNLRYHLVKDSSKSYQPFGYAIDTEKDDPILLVHADRLPVVDTQNTMPLSRGKEVVLYCLNDTLVQNNKIPKWSGWGWLPREYLTEISTIVDEGELASHLMSLPNSKRKIVNVSKVLSVESCIELISAQRKALSKERTDLILTGKEVEEGIWLSRNISLHPTVKLLPPVYIGENCRIGKKVQLGPYVTVGQNSVLSDKSTVKDSIIYPGSFVGDALELSDILIDRNCLVNVRLGSEVIITDDFIISSLTDRKVKDWGKKIISQCLASAFLVFLLPLLLFIIFYRKLIVAPPIFHKKKVVKLPAFSDMTLWRTFSLISFCHNFSTRNEKKNKRYKTETNHTVGWRDLFLRFFPALINVARGELRFVGVRPRTIEEIKALPEDWRSLYLKSKAGIVTEALVSFGSLATDDDLYSAEAMYSVSADWKYDLKILAKYIGQILGVLPLPVR